MRRSHSLAKTPGGDAQGGLGPSCGGSRLHRRCQRFLLARDVPSGVGGTRLPRLAPGGGNGKGGDQKSSSLWQAYQSSGGDRISLQLEGHFMDLPHFRCSWPS